MNIANHKQYLPISSAASSTSVTGQKLSELYTSIQ